MPVRVREMFILFGRHLEPNSDTFSHSNLKNNRVYQLDFFAQALAFTLDFPINNCVK
jgi:hypothetical protein